VAYYKPDFSKTTNSQVLSKAFFVKGTINLMGLCKSKEFNELRRSGRLKFARKFRVFLRVLRACALSQFRFLWSLITHQQPNVIKLRKREEKLTTKGTKNTKKR